MEAWPRLTRFQSGESFSDLRCWSGGGWQAGQGQGWGLAGMLAVPCPLILLSVRMAPWSGLRVAIKGGIKWQAVETMLFAVGRDPMLYLVGWGRGAAVG